jgi:hypothetical protein
MTERRDDDVVDEEERRAAEEAAHIGGTPTYDVDLEEVDEADRAVIEGGGGESEGFELAEELLVEHASHADEGSTTEILHDADTRAEEQDGDPYGEADSEIHPDA